MCKIRLYYIKCEDTAHTSPPLFNAQVSVDGGIASSTSQILVLPIGYVSTRPVVSVLLGQTKVNQEQFVTVTANTH